MSSLSRELSKKGKDAQKAPNTREPIIKTLNLNILAIYISIIFRGNLKIQIVLQGFKGSWYRMFISPFLSWETKKGVALKSHSMNGLSEIFAEKLDIWYFLRELFSVYGMYFQINISFVHFFLHFLFLSPNFGTIFEIQYILRNSTQSFLAANTQL